MNRNETTIPGNINLTTLARTNQGAIPLPVTLVPNERDGRPVLHIGNSSGWYLSTLCSDGIACFQEQPLSIWGDYHCLNIHAILTEAAAAVGWDFTDEVLPPVIERYYTTEIKRETCPHAPAFKWRMIITDVETGAVRNERWKKTRKDAETEQGYATAGKPTATYWRGNQKYIDHFKEVTP